LQSADLFVFDATIPYKGPEKALFEKTWVLPDIGKVG
jgi:hypothetical protein